MRITILGSAAGGGFPQWNCNCRLCAGVRHGTVRAHARTQSSIFVQADHGEDGVLFNASPDLLTQIRANPHLQPARAARDSAIAAVVLTDGQIDHSTGLAMLRERRAPLPVWCTDAVADDLSSGYPLLNVLGHFCGVERHAIPLDGTAFEVPQVPGVRFRAVPSASKPAPYSPRRDAPGPGDNIAVVIEDAARGSQVLYAPGLGAITPEIDHAMHTADAVLVDGTFWTDDEMIALGLSSKRARDIGHLPQTGAGGMLEVLRGLPAHTRRWLIHINNTNPILDEDSPERAALTRERVSVCEDGLILDL